MTRLLLADDHVAVRQAFRALLERAGFDVVAEAGDGEEAIRLARAHRPDAAILDLRMPTLDGLSAARVILDEGTCPSIVLLSGYVDGAGLAEARAVGVQAYVLKDQAADDLIEAITAVGRGEQYFGPMIGPLMPPEGIAGPPPTLSVLTPREREVLRLIALGKSTREIADELGLSVKTIGTHRTNIMGKLDIHKATDLVRYAIRRGLVEP